MTGNRFSRRAVAVGGGVAVALGLAAVGINTPRWWQAYPHTEYDDLLERLVDREQAIRVGQAVRDAGATPEARTLARDLRQRFGRRSTAAAIDTDLGEDRLREAEGWVLPESLALLCVLAAEVS